MVLSRCFFASLAATLTVSVRCTDTPSGCDADESTMLQASRYLKTAKTALGEPGARQPLPEVAAMITHIHEMEHEESDFRVRLHNYMQTADEMDANARTQEEGDLESAARSIAQHYLDRADEHAAYQHSALLQRQAAGQKIDSSSEQASTVALLNGRATAGQGETILEAMLDDKNPAPGPAPPPTGFYRIQQKVNNRFVDAYDSGNNYEVKTTPRQNNPSQMWYLASVGAADQNVFTIQQVGQNDFSRLGRFLDAHEGGDFGLVTRPAQNNPSQQWRFTSSEGNSFTIQHMVNQRFVDAHESQSNDWQLVTRDQQNNDSQRWILTPLAGEEMNQAVAVWY